MLGERAGLISEVVSLLRSRLAADLDTWTASPLGNRDANAYRRARERLTQATDIRRHWLKFLDDLLLRRASGGADAGDVVGDDAESLESGNRGHGGIDDDDGAEGADAASVDLAHALERLLARSQGALAALGFHRAAVAYWLDMAAFDADLTAAASRCLARDAHALLKRLHAARAAPASPARGVCDAWRYRAASDFVAAADVFISTDTPCNIEMHPIEMLS
ncbi:hypothetical protein HK405_006255 [Cladochytrium tenue]|nr:hypothetical protein HK405_006255 [Cladochytrium tenue]